MKTSIQAWNEAAHHATRLSGMGVGELVSSVLGEPLRELEEKVASCEQTASNSLRYLVSQQLAVNELQDWASPPKATGSVVFVPQLHEFGDQGDDEAYQFQQALATFILGRASPQKDVLIVEGVFAGPVNESRIIKQLGDLERIRGNRPRNRSFYDRIMNQLRRQNPVFDLTLSGRFHSAGIEVPWVSEMCQVALAIEDANPVGVSLPIAYLLIELRNRIALKCAIGRMAASSRRAVIVMGALHAFGLQNAAEKAGLQWEMWIHPSLATYFSNHFD